MHNSHRYFLCKNICSRSDSQLFPHAIYPFVRMFSLHTFQDYLIQIVFSKFYVHDIEILFFLY